MSDFIRLVCTGLLLLAASAHVRASSQEPDGAPRVEGPTGDPRGSFAYKNFLRAEEVLEQAIEAHGGRALLAGELDLRLRYTGRLWNQAHYERPWARHEYALAGELRTSAAGRALLWQGSSTYDRALHGFVWLDSERGIALGFGARSPRELAPEDLEELREEELRLFAHESLRRADPLADDGADGCEDGGDKHARDQRGQRRRRHDERQRLPAARRDSLRFLASEGGEEVLQYTGADGTNSTLFIDAQTHLLRRVERLLHEPGKGDRLEWTEFSDYRSRANGQFAFERRSHREQHSTQYDDELHIEELSVGEPVPREELLLPAESLGGLTPLALAAVGTEDLLPMHDLGAGVHLIDLEASDSRAMLVEFDDFCVVIEGGDRSEVAEALLETAAAHFPKKPVRFVAMSHHHPLYTGGLRPYVQRGVTVLATPGNVDYLRELIARPYRLEPDALELDPRAAVIEVMDPLHVIEDESQRLELHTFGTSGHTEEYVLTYVAPRRIGFLGDLLYVMEDEPLRPAGDRALAVHALVNELELEIVDWSQTWFLERGKAVFPMSDLEEQVRLRREQDAGR